MDRVKLTPARIRDFTCPPDKTQAFLWDTEAPGLALRATPGSEARAFIFQSKLKGEAASWAWRPRELARTAAKPQRANLFGDGIKPPVFG